MELAKRKKILEAMQGELMPEYRAKKALLTIPELGEVKDTVDKQSDIMLLEVSISNFQITTEMLRLVNNALARIEAGSYGGCEECGEGIPEEERVANSAAANFCVPRQKMESFILRKNPFFYEKDVLAFAKLNGVHPGLPVGQIQYSTGLHDYLRKYQTKIRQFVTPGAIVDGWDQSLDLA